MNAPDCQLYLISPQDVSGDFSRQLTAVLEAGAQLVSAFQFRVKGIDQHEAARLAQPLQAICADHDLAFVVNDDVALAKRLKADGVHLGQSDGPDGQLDIADARERLGREVQIGVTCHDSRHLAMEAGEGGADYVAFGAFYPSATKDTQHRPQPEILEWWSGLFELPCVAIGGITPANCAPLVAAGADFLAVSSAVWNAADPAEAVRQFASAIAKARTTRKE